MAVTQPKNATVSNPVEAALNAFKAGADPEAAVYGGASSNPSPSSSNNPQLIPEDGDENSETGSDESSNTEGLQDASQAGDAGAESENVANAAGAPQEDTDSHIYVTDESGRKKIKVDFSDKAKVKKAFEYAYGFRKMQAERDKSNAYVKQIEPEYKELKQSWAAIDKAVQEGGLKGLVNLISGDEKAFDSLIEKEVGLRDWKKTATPSEIERYDAQEMAASEKRAREKLEKEFQGLRDNVAQTQSDAQMKMLESKVNPAFDKWRFAGKLNNPTLEEMLDKSIWTTALDNLENARQKLGIAEHEMPASMIDQEFRKVRSAFEKVSSVQAETKTSQIMQQKKAAAQEKVVAHASKAMAKQTDAEAFASQIRGGNFVDAFRNALTGKR